jgi:hypothetical protein
MNKILIVLAMLALYYPNSFAQDTAQQDIKIKFINDGVYHLLNNDFKVCFIKGKDTTEASISADKIKLPYGLKTGDKTKMLFTTSECSLVFPALTISVNNLNPTWEIGIDKEPFDKEEHWMIKDWSNIQIVYYMNNNNGGLTTVRQLTNDTKDNYIVKKEALDKRGKSKFVRL